MSKYQFLTINQSHSGLSRLAPDASERGFGEEGGFEAVDVETKRCQMGGGHKAKGMTALEMKRGEMGEVTT